MYFINFIDLFYSFFVMYSKKTETFRPPLFIAYFEDFFFFLEK